VVPNDPNGPAASRAVLLCGFLGGVMAYTREQVERASRVLSDDERWSKWVACPQHDVPALPVTEDTGDHYCPNCCTLFTPGGAALNAPHQPGTRQG
jgi:hypothetical protein